MYMNIHIPPPTLTIICWFQAEMLWFIRLAVSVRLSRELYQLNSSPNSQEAVILQIHPGCLWVELIFNCLQGESTSSPISGWWSQLLAEAPSSHRSNCILEVVVGRKGEHSILLLPLVLASPGAAHHLPSSNNTAWAGAISPLAPRPHVRGTLHYTLHTKHLFKIIELDNIQTGSTSLKGV